MAWVLRFVVREAVEFLLRRAFVAMARGAVANLLPRTAVSRL